MKEISLAAIRISLDDLIRMAADEDGVMLTSHDNDPRAVILDIEHYRSLQGLVALAYGGQWSDIYADYQRRTVQKDMSDVHVVRDPRELP